jgi:hypothetical protein
MSASPLTAAPTSPAAPLQTAFPTMPKEQPFPGPDTREGIEMPCGLLSRGIRRDLDSLMPTKGQSSHSRSERRMAMT